MPKKRKTPPRKANGQFRKRKGATKRKSKRKGK
jgi:hypothetical protein